MPDILYYIFAHPTLYYCTYRVYAYSAFYDDRREGSKFVRLHVAAPLKWKSASREVRCVLETGDGAVVTTGVRMTTHKEHFNLPFVSYFLDCLTGAGSFAKVGILRTTYPTDNELLINFRLSSDAEILLISTD